MMCLSKPYPTRSPSASASLPRIGNGWMKPPAPTALRSASSSVGPLLPSSNTSTHTVAASTSRLISAPCGNSASSPAPSKAPCQTQTPDPTLRRQPASSKRPKSAWSENNPWPMGQAALAAPVNSGVCPSPGRIASSRPSSRPQAGPTIPPPIPTTEAPSWTDLRVITKI